MSIMDSSYRNPDETIKNDIEISKRRPSGEEQKPLVEEENVFPLKDLPPPPDGGWGWVITFASFMCNLIVDGINYTFGVLLNPLVEDFNSNRSTVSWVGSLLAGVYLTSGPIVGSLVNKYGCRTVCIAGSLVAAVGIGFSIFSPNLPMLMVTYGVIGGFGLCMVYLPAIVSVGYYFEKKRALATGISVCGSGIGTFLMAPLSTYLLDLYGWRGANLIFAGLCLNCAVFGALMRPLELKTVVHRPNNELNLDKEDKDGDEMSPAVQMVATPSSDLPSFPRQRSGSVTAPVKEDHRAISNVFPEVQIKESSPKPRTIRTPSESPSQADHNRLLVTPVNDTAIPRNRTNMAQGNSFAALSFHRVSIVPSNVSLPLQIGKTSFSEQTGEPESEPSKPIWTALKEMTNFRLLVNKYFMLIAISNVFGMLGFYVPFVYLPNMAVLKNVSIENANFLLSIIGISNTVGRVITGWFSDFPFVNTLFVTNMAILLSGLSVIVLPFCSSYEAFVYIALLFGLFVAAYISLTSIILVDLLGLDNLTSAFGLLILFRGFASIIGPPVAGSVYDMTNSYDVSFFLAGGCLVVASLISFVAEVLQKMEENKKKKRRKTKSIAHVTDPVQLN